MLLLSEGEPADFLHVIIEGAVELFAHGNRRQRVCVVLEHVEVRVERRDLECIRHRKSHLLGKRGQVSHRDAVVAVLDEVQELDQQVALTWPIAEQFAHLVKRLRLDLATLRHSACAAAPGAG